MTKGTIYMIPCPISESSSVWDVLPENNREVMNSLDYFIVENTRSARRFLSKAGVERKIEELEFVELNEHTTDAREVERMLKPVLEGRSAGVISEAGVPGVADPGAAIVALAHRYGVRVVPLVGPSSILMSVMASSHPFQPPPIHGILFLALRLHILCQQECGQLSCCDCHYDNTEQQACLLEEFPLQS